LTVGYVVDNTTIFPQFLHYSSSQFACQFWHIGQLDIPHGYMKLKISLIHTGHKTTAMSTRPRIALRFERLYQSTHTLDQVWSTEGQGSIRFHWHGTEWPVSRRQTRKQSRKSLEPWWDHITWLSRTNGYAHRPFESFSCPLLAPSLIGCFQTAIKLILTLGHVCIYGITAHRIQKGRTEEN
jgi:hypothetical protein